MPTPVPLASSSLVIALGMSPSGHVILDPGPPADSLLDDRLAAPLVASGGGDDAATLVELAARHPDDAMPPSIAFFRDLARRVLAQAAASPTGTKVLDPPDDLDDCVLAAPPMAGHEYVTSDAMRALWIRLADALRRAVGDAALEDWLGARHATWSVVGRVCFHLAENKGDSERPFAFLATYATSLSVSAKVQHRPLGQALLTSTTRRDRDASLRLLLPVHRAAERSQLVRQMVDDGSVFRALAWTATQAHRFLKELPALQSAGVVVRVPDWWRPASPSRVVVQVRIGATQPLGAAQLVPFDVGLAIDGAQLDESEWRQLQESTDDFVRLRGRWVEIDREKLQEVLRAWKAAQRAARLGIPFHEAMRLLAGVDDAEAGSDELADRGWSRVEAGPWMRDVLAMMRSPESCAGRLPGKELRATLRHYQQDGVRWLAFLNELGLGGCLADDMGLGKTVQVLALLLLLKKKRSGARHLLVAPASLLSNWKAEAERFAPSLRVAVAHASGDGTDPEVAEGADLVATTYGTLVAQAWMRETAWDTLVLDEAQAIKNPGAKQSRAAKAVPARVRIALTGTPVENRAGDLWSLFDFLQRGLLGSADEFRRFASASAQSKLGWTPVRKLVAPYILRRMKTDPGVAPDLPAKTEMMAECGLTKEQAVLYNEAVQELKAVLAGMSLGIERRGAVLASLLRLKQICNHPSHRLGDGGWEPGRSGKLQRLAELVEPIAQRQEKVLVFSQFREAVEPVAAALATFFGRSGLVLHGGTAIATRKEIVSAFQSDESVPFLVLSLKAGGTGLNLTSATHVVHFDRWWNPAVEDQATDRAFRIGQKKPVFVHAMVCRGTLEERVDDMIRGKRGLARRLLAGEAEINLTEMSDEQLLSTVSLDLARATMES